MKYRYRIIDISSEDGFREAEALKEQGFFMSLIGIDKVQFSIPKTK